MGVCCLKKPGLFHFPKNFSVDHEANKLMNENEKKTSVTFIKTEFNKYCVRFLNVYVI